jgi:hypothetical protein
MAGRRDTAILIDRYVMNLYGSKQQNSTILVEENQAC